MTPHQKHLATATPLTAATAAQKLAPASPSNEQQQRRHAWHACESWLLIAAISVNCAADELAPLACLCIVTCLKKVLWSEVLRGGLHYVEWLDPVYSPNLMQTTHFWTWPIHLFDGSVQTVSVGSLAGQRWGLRTPDSPVSLKRLEDLILRKTSFLQM